MFSAHCISFLLRMQVRHKEARLRWNSSHTWCIIKDGKKILPSRKTSLIAFRRIKMDLYEVVALASFSQWRQCYGTDGRQITNTLISKSQRSPSVFSMESLFCKKGWKKQNGRHGYSLGGKHFNWKIQFLNLVGFIHLCVNVFGSSHQ